MVAIATEQQLEECLGAPGFELPSWVHRTWQLDALSEAWGVRVANSPIAYDDDSYIIEAWGSPRVGFDNK